MKKIIFLFSILTFLFSQAEITNIQASQRTDGSQIVDITYDLLPDPIFEFFNINVFVSLNDGDWLLMSNVSGDLGDIVETGYGKALTWNFGEQFGGTYSNQIKIKIEGEAYALIDNNNNQELPFEMVAVAAGEYTFGENDEMRNIEYDYEIMKYPVTDMDYVLFMLDKLSDVEEGDCIDIANADGSSWLSFMLGFTCEDFEYEGYCDYGIATDFTNDLGYNANEACCACGGGMGSSGYVAINSNKLTGYYPGDANNPPGNYDYIIFENSKISWNDEIFEVEEGNVNHPVTGVTWFGAWAFATHYGMEIPDQYEWEKAARGNTGYDYPWGEEFIEEAVNCCDHNKTSPVDYYNGDSHIIYGCLDDDNCGELITLSFVEPSCNWQINNYSGQTILGNSTCGDYQYLIPPGDYTLIIWNTDAMTFTYQDITNTYSASGQPLAIPFTILGDEIEYETYDAISPLGAYDMAGNTWEIVGNDDNNQIYLKGGAYNSNQNEIQSWNYANYNTGENIGFRCIRVINQPSSRNIPKEKLNQFHLNEKNKIKESKDKE